MSGAKPALLFASASQQKAYQARGGRASDATGGQRRPQRWCRMAPLQWGPHPVDIATQQTHDLRRSRERRLPSPDLSQPTVLPHDNVVVNP